MLLIIAYFLSRFVIRFLTIRDEYLMPIIAVFCVIGSYATTYTKFSLLVLLAFGILGCFMKIYNYPIPPMLLGILIGGTMDTALRRAMMQYGNAPMEMITRPIGLVIIVFLILVFALSIRTTKRTSAASEKSTAEFNKKFEDEIK